MGAPVSTVLDDDITPWQVIHGYTYAMVTEFSKVIMHGVRNVIEVWCEVRFTSELVYEVSPRRREGKAGR